MRPGIWLCKVSWSLKGWETRKLLRSWSEENLGQSRKILVNWTEMWVMDLGEKTTWVSGCNRGSPWLNSYYLSDQIFSWLSHSDHESCNANVSWSKRLLVTTQTPCYPVFDLLWNHWNTWNDFQVCLSSYWNTDELWAKTLPVWFLSGAPNFVFGLF
jgi:hypothetical protein